MRNAEAFLLTWAANAAWMTCAMAALAAALTRLLQRAPAAHRHAVWATALALSLLLPFAAIRPATAPLPQRTERATPAAGALETFRNAAANASLPMSNGVTAAVATALLAFMLLRAFRLVRAWRIVTALRRGRLIRYADVAAPFTAGIRRPVIVLPRSLATRATERRAAIAHEIAHVRRHDFLLNVVYECLLVPLAWHPAARFLKSRIDQTRELACDDLAARAPADYAQTLLNLARVVWATSETAPHFALTMFDSDSLEKRIRNLLDGRSRVGLRRARWLLAAAIALLGAASIAAATHTISVAAGGDTKSFAGHWIADFDGHRFFSMQLDANGGGTIDNFGFFVDADGDLIGGEAKPGAAQITQTRPDGSVLHIAAEELVTTSKGEKKEHLVLDLALTSGNRGEIRIPDSRVKPWAVERR